jgi:DNA-binding PadR family transcriptional regulator
MRAELLKGHTDLLLLHTLEAGPAHGYRIIELLRERSGGELDLPEGTIYPALHRLERVGAIRSSWDESGPRRRRVYELTGRGRSSLHSKRAEWSGFVRTIAAVVGGPGV